MKKHISVVMLLGLGLVLALGATPLMAQTGGVHGVCKDQDGKFITDGVVELTNTDSGRKMSAKTDKNGEYHMIGLTPGTYNAVLTRNGKQVDSLSKVPIGVGDNVPVDFDLKKDLAKAGPSEEDLRKQQEAVKQNEKIKGLNAKLAEARDLEKAGNWDQAISIMQEATTADPTKDLLWAYLGEAYVGAKKYPEAVESFQKALAIKSDSALYHNGLANAYAKSNQTDKAVAEYTTAAQIDPANAATAYFNIGVVYYNINSSDQAIAAFDKAIELKPDRAEAYFYKGQALLGKMTTGKDGKVIAAPGTAEAYRKYLELKPDGPLAQTAKDNLAMIGSSVETTYGKQKAPAKKKPN